MLKCFPKGCNVHIVRCKKGLNCNKCLMSNTHTQHAMISPNKWPAGFDSVNNSLLYKWGRSEKMCLIKYNLKTNIHIFFICLLRTSHVFILTLNGEKCVKGVKIVGRHQCSAKMTVLSNAFGKQRICYWETKAIFTYKFQCRENKVLTLSIVVIQTCLVGEC